MTVDEAVAAIHEILCGHPPPGWVWRSGDAEGEIPTEREKCHQVKRAISRKKPLKRDEITTFCEVLEPAAPMVSPPAPGEIPPCSIVKGVEISILRESILAPPKRSKSRPMIRCPQCGRRRPHKGRGLCGMCWERVRVAERKAKMGDCNRCEYWKSMSNPRKGVRIPNGFGKCTRARGHCSPATPRGGIGGNRSEWAPRGGAKGGK